MRTALCRKDERGILGDKSKQGVRRVRGPCGESSGVDAGGRIGIAASQKCKGTDEAGKQAWVFGYGVFNALA